MNNFLSIDNYINIGLLIITIASILSPIVVAIINSYHDIKIKKLEIDSKIKQQVLDEFSQYVVELHGYNYIDGNFYKSLNLLYIYFDVDDELIEHIMTTKYKDNISFQKDVSILMRKLSKQIQYK